MTGLQGSIGCPAKAQGLALFSMGIRRPDSSASEYQFLTLFHLAR